MATYDRDEFEAVPFTRTCKYCNKSGLEWFRNPINGKYALYTKDMVRHDCRRTMLAPDTATPSEDVTELHK